MISKLSKNIEIILVDNHALVRQGIATILNHTPGFTIIGEASSGQDAVSLCHTLSPDMVLMDIAMPGMDGIQATRLIHAEHPHIKVVGLSSYMEPSIVEEAARAGILHYISKNTTATQLVDRLYRIVQEEVRSAPTQSTDKAVNLTSREIEILILLGGNSPLKKIASQLGISHDTVKTHVRHIYEKLDVNSRQEAVAYAIRTGLIS